jgi:hypothetical protein
MPEAVGSEPFRESLPTTALETTALWNIKTIKL